MNVLVSIVHVYNPYHFSLVSVGRKKQQQWYSYVVPLVEGFVKHTSKNLKLDYLVRSE